MSDQTTRMRPFASDQPITHAVERALSTVHDHSSTADLLFLERWEISPVPGAAAALLRRIGWGLLRAAPLLMKALAVLGTAAMFMVGGGILLHGLPWLHALTDGLAALWTQTPDASLLLSVARRGAAWLLELLVGLAAGGLVYLALHLGQRLRPAQP